MKKSYPCWCRLLSDPVLLYVQATDLREGSAMAVLLNGVNCFLILCCFTSKQQAVLQRWISNGIVASSNIETGGGGSVMTVLLGATPTQGGGGGDLQ